MSQSKNSISTTLTIARSPVTHSTKLNKRIRENDHEHDSIQCSFVGDAVHFCIRRSGGRVDRPRAERTAPRKSLRHQPQSLRLSKSQALEDNLSLRPARQVRNDATAEFSFSRSCIAELERYQDHDWNRSEPTNGLRRSGETPPGIY